MIPPPQSKQCFTIGHGNYPIDRFIGNVRSAGIDTIIDVHSFPYSRFNPHFNRENLEKSLEESAINYQFMGDRLGGRSGTGPCWKASTAPQQTASPQTPLLQSSAGSIKSTRPLHGQKDRYGGACPAGCRQPQSRQGPQPDPPRDRRPAGRPGHRSMRRRRSRHRSHGTFPYRMMGHWGVGGKRLVL